jgi:hypothetical protein
MENNLKSYAHVVEEKVVNVSLWDGKTLFEIKEELIEIPAGSTAGIGWNYKAGKFEDNRPASPPPSQYNG